MADKAEVYAFPWVEAKWDDTTSRLEVYDTHAGMSLRDWFAAQAMLGLLSNPAYSIKEKDGATHLAELSFILAEAMIAKREEE